jgi:hypothetical protein
LEELGSPGWRGGYYLKWRSACHSGRYFGRHWGLKERHLVGAVVAAEVVMAPDFGRLLVAEGGM